MSDPVKHHYIPVFYLKNWAASDGKVIRYYRPHKELKASPIAPDNTGFENDLYSLEGCRPEIRNSIEKGFMSKEVDNDASLALNALCRLDQENRELSSEMRQAWTRFLMSMAVRTPTKVKEITTSGENILRESLSKNPEEYDAIRDFNHPPTLLEYAEINAPYMFPNFGKDLLPRLINHESTNNAINSMEWGTISIDRNGPELFLGDRPLYISHQIKDESSLIAIPLSPKKLFIATRSSETFDKLMRGDLNLIAKKFNEITVTQAQSQIYATNINKSYFNFIDKRLNRCF